ncbi:MAG: hypothetical protein NVSMB47_19590 [Polyangiales bacterium]
MIFDTLMLVSLGIAAVALFRLRPATFIFAGNQIGVLRALSHVEALGQPRSQAFLPPSIFSLANLAIAQNLFLLSTALLAVAVLLPGPAGRAPEPLPRLPRWLFALILLYLAAVIFSQKTILTHSYTDPDRYLYGFNLSGGHALIASIFLYEMVRRAMTGEWTRLAAFGSLLLLFLLTDYLKGTTGLATGYLVVSAFLVLGGEPRLRKRWLTLGGAMAAIVLMALIVRGTRATLFNEGTSSIASLRDTLQDDERRTSRTGEGAEVMGNGVQYAAHVLECIALYEAHVSREWRSIYLPVLYTFQPRFVIDLLGLERAKEAAWELGDYYIHGGGIYVLGELYWNGGYLCAAIVYTFLMLFCWLCDTRWRTSFVWLLLLCEFAPGTLQGVGYGFAQVSRGILNGLLVLACYAALRKRRAPQGDLSREAHA